MINRVVRFFLPFGNVAETLQAEFQLSRPPGCRREHGRLEITVRGAAITDQPVAARIDLATRLANSARPVLRVSNNSQVRRQSDRAILIVFEDERIIDGGIATSRFSYLAPTEHEEFRIQRRG